MINLVVVAYLPPDLDGARRSDGFRVSLASWDKHLIAPDLRLIMVNDGPVLPAWPEWSRQQIGLGHERNGLGASLNQGLRAAFEVSPLALSVPDDYLLASPYDLSPWAKMLMEDAAVGAVRLSSYYPGTGGTIEPRTGGWVVTLDRHNLAAGLRPTLYHKRFFDAYGFFDEGISAWETERQFNERFCQAGGPESVLALPLPWADGPGSAVLQGQASPKGEGCGRAPRTPSADTEDQSHEDRPAHTRVAS